MRKHAAIESISQPLRALYFVAGLLAVGLALLGVALPVLPTTPFLLLAMWCFSRSSPRWRQWLLDSPVFGAFLRAWARHRGVRRSVKYWAVAMVLSVVGMSLATSMIAVGWQMALLVFAGIGLTVIWRLPVINTANETAHFPRAESNVSSQHAA